MAKKSSPTINNPLFQEVSEWFESKKKKPHISTLATVIDTMRAPSPETVKLLQEENQALSKSLLDAKLQLENSKPMQLEDLLRRLEEIANPLVSSAEGKGKVFKQRVEIGLNDLGKPIYEWATGRTAKEFHRRIALLLIKHGIVTLSDAPSLQTGSERTKRIKFKNYTHNFIETYKKPRLKPTSLSAITTPLDTNILPFFGEYYLDEITPDLIQTFLNERKEYARRYLGEMRRIIKEILTYGKEDGYTVDNPAESKRISNPSEKKKERRALTREQLYDIIQNLSKVDEMGRKYLALALFTGMRKGEVLGLRWEDIDGDIAHIRRAVTTPSNQPIVGTPKTEKGTRTIPIPSLLWAFLNPTAKEGYIINNDGNPLSKTMFINMWRRINTSINLYGITSHELRHTYITLSSRTEIPIASLKDVVGHSDIRTTMSYMHSQEEAAIAVKKILDEVFDAAIESPVTDL